MKLSIAEITTIVSEVFPRSTGKWGFSDGEWTVLTDGLNRIGIDSDQLTAIVNGQRLKSDRASIKDIMEQARVARYGQNNGPTPDGKPRPWTWIDTARRSMKMREDTNEQSVVIAYWQTVCQNGHKVNGNQFDWCYARQCENDLGNVGHPDPRGQAEEIFGLSLGPVVAPRPRTAALAEENLSTPPTTT